MSREGHNGALKSLVLMVTELALSEFLEACQKCRISGPPPDQRESESALQQDLWVIHMQIIFGGSVCLLQCPQFLFFEDQNDKFTAGFKS